MEKIDWCRGQRGGLKVVEPSLDISEGYLKMAEDSLGVMNREKDKSLIFTVSAGYYSLYYSLYAVMQRLGIKSEIHSCSIAFMKNFLREFYDLRDIKLIEVSFNLRNTLQYYVGRRVGRDDINLLLKSAYDFYVKSRDIVAGLTEKKNKEIRREFENG